MKTKMTIASFALLLAIPIKGFTNRYNFPETGKDTIDPVDNSFVITEMVAQFPGGDKAFENYVQSNIQYPIIAQQQNIQGKVIASVDIDTMGNIHHVTILQGIGGGCDEEVIRLLNSMPQWNPALQAGHQVKTKRVFSFNFQL